MLAEVASQVCQTCISDGPRAAECPEPSHTGPPEDTEGAPGGRWVSREPPRDTKGVQRRQAWIGPAPYEEFGVRILMWANLYVLGTQALYLTAT